MSSANLPTTTFDASTAAHSNLRDTVIEDSMIFQPREQISTTPQSSTPQKAQQAPTPSLTMSRSGAKQVRNRILTSYTM
ncbi:hypothetical protein KC322_g118 [Hortaea werneckii]|nr:hypothetical protein KC322_g118 [Hortaea werneckii]